MRGGVAVKKAERGSILILVVIIFAVILIMGTMLITKAQASHKYAIIETNHQQAEYVVKSIVDAVKKDIMHHGSDSPSDRLSDWVAKTSTELGKVTFTDAVGQIWNGTVKVEDDKPNVGQVLITAKVKGTGGASNIEEQLSGVIKKSVGVGSNALEADTNLSIEVQHPITINQPILSTAGMINIIARDKLKLDRVTASSRITLTLKDSPIVLSELEELEVKHLKSWGEGVTIISDKPVKISRIDAFGEVKITAPEVQVGEYIRSYAAIKINADIYSGNGTLRGHSITYKKKNGSEYPVGFAPYALSTIVPDVAAVYATPPPLTPPSTPIVSNSDITIYQRTPDIITAQYVEGTIWREIDLSPNTPYTFSTSDNTRSVYIGIKRDCIPGTPVVINNTLIDTNKIHVNSSTQEVTVDPNHGGLTVTKTGINGKGLEYSLFLHLATTRPFQVFIIDPQDISLIGNLQTGNAGTGGFRIMGISNKFKIGPPGYKFIEYIK